MANVIPNGQVTFYEDVEPDMFFLSESERTSYYASKRQSVISEDNYKVDPNLFSYINHADGVIRIPLNYADTRYLWRCNYLSFTSSHEEWSNSNRVYYCKIVDYRRVNNKVVDVYYGIDWLQTDMFEYRISYAQVERETSPVGTYITGDSNTLYTQEGLPIAEPLQYNALSPFAYSDGSYTQSMERGDSSYLRYGGANEDDYRIVIVAIEDEKGLGYDQQFAGLFDPQNIETNQNGRGLYGVYISKSQYRDYFSVGKFPQPYYIVVQKPDTTGVGRIQDVLDSYASNEMTSSIIGVYYIPTFVLTPRLIDGSVVSNIIGHNVAISTPYTLASLRANKLNVSPYSYLRVIASDGVIKLYNIELFANPQLIQFTLTGNIAAGVPVGSLVPRDYQGFSYNMNERMSLPAFPEVAYTIDGNIVYQSAVRQSLIEQHGSSIAHQLDIANAKTARAQANLYETGVFGNLTNEVLGSQTGQRIASGLGGAIGGAIGGPIFGDAFAKAGSELASNSLGEAANKLGEFGRTIMAGSNAMYQAQVAQQRGQASVLHSQSRAAEEAMTARVSGAPYETNGYMSRFMADGAQLQDYFSPASGDITPYLTGFDGLRFDFVTLREGLREQYTKYFDMFGYTNGSIRRPCLSHHNGATSQSNDRALACFHTDPFNSDYTQGYVKCSSINITGISEESAQWIRSRFLSGIVFHREVS